MSGPDRRHAVGVARRVGSSDLLEAALLHDVGKIESGLGTFARVFATVAGSYARSGPFALYRQYPVIGARLLADAGAAPLTVAWAAEHHLPEERWTVPVAAGRILQAADDE
jgi:response regulator RpfG family c-di-GMP phosphodiesterase